jgi:hypothetical protein
VDCLRSALCTFFLDLESLDIVLSNLLVSHVLSFSTTFLLCIRFRITNMDEKPTTNRRSRSTSPSLAPHTQTTRKTSITSAHHHKKSAEIARIDALATAPGVSMASFAHLDEKAILRKMDLRLIPMLALLYLLSFLDRGNIGNAKIEGLTEDLHMSGAQYNWCLTVFFFTYAAFEVPSNLLLKKLRPSIWLPTIMVAWGVVMTLMGIVQSYEGLLVARIFLGVTEAGLFPGVRFLPGGMWREMVC